jgi:N-methylhydantoinase B
MTVSGEVKIDPITFEVLRNSYKYICTEANELLRAVSYSPTIAEGKDSSISLLTSDGRLVSHGESDMCPHMGTFEEAVKFLIDLWGGEMEHGDVFIHNDPVTGGTHTNDVKIIRPIFYDGELIAFACTTAHWSDVGGPIPGTFNPQATEAYAEGIRIPGLKLFEKDRPKREVLELVKRNVRLYPERLGEIMGQYKACLYIEEMLKKNIKKYGLKTVLTSFEEVMDYSERVFRNELSQIPDGVAEFADFGDEDPLAVTDKPIKVHCKLVKEGDKVTLDYTDSDDEPIASWGFTRPALLSAAYAATMHMFPILNPLNHGVIRMLEIKSRQGSCVHVGENKGVSGYCSGAYEKVLWATMGAWAKLLYKVKPERVNAGAVNLMNVCTAGWHPKKKRNFVSYLWMEGGLGARTYKDGISGILGFYIGQARNQPVEVHERWYTMTYTNVEIVPDSCGHGKYRGGVGFQRNFTVWHDSVITIHADRERVTPYGLAGGLNGGPAKLILNKGTDREVNLGMFAVGVKLKAGDHITFQSNGGGGFGNPLERDPRQVLEDVIDGFITLETAREVYGVIIKVKDEERLIYEIDEHATKMQREKLARRQFKEGLGPFEIHPYGKAS